METLNEVPILAPDGPANLGSQSVTPSPGSDAAIKAGCICPVMDNGRGRGYILQGERVWVWRHGCPLHMPPSGSTGTEQEGHDDVR